MDTSPPRSELVEAIEASGFPSPAGENHFDKCYHSSETPDYGVCDAIELSECPYTTGRSCKNDAEFYRGILRETSFDFPYSEFSGDDLYQYLNDSYGKPKFEQRGSPTVGMTSWSRTWSSGRLAITMLRLKGTNIEGVPYDNVSVMFADKHIPSFMDAVNSRSNSSE